MAVKCANCGGAHPSWDCSKPSKSTAARKADVPRSSEVRPLPEGEGRQKMRKQTEISDSIRGPSEISASPVDTPPKPKIGRPRTGFNKKEYNRQFTADLRTIKRLGLEMTVKEWRKTNEKN